MNNMLWSIEAESSNWDHKPIRTVFPQVIYERRWWYKKSRSLEVIKKKASADVSPAQPFNGLGLTH